MDISLPGQASASRAIGADAGRAQLWNPRAATLWGILLSPAFSAYIHMRNWQALGQDDQAAQARTWFYLVLGFLVAGCFLAIAGHVPGRDPTPPLASALGLLVAWHVWGGRAQERYLAAVIGAAYVRRPWARPVCGALGVVAAIVLSSAVVNVIIGP